MVLTINGKRESVAAERLSVVELLKLKDVAMPDMVSVQINGDILTRGDYAATLVKDNDQVEFLYFMGGGAFGGGGALGGGDDLGCCGNR